MRRTVDPINTEKFEWNETQIRVESPKEIREGE